MSMKNQPMTFRLADGTREKLQRITAVHQKNLDVYMKKVNLDNDKLNVRITPSNVLQTLIEDEYKKLFEEKPES